MGLARQGYIVEIQSDDIVWLIDEQRHLKSIHQTVSQASHYCRKHFHWQPVIVDRRRNFAEFPD